MFLLYNAIMTLLAPIWVPIMIVRARKRKEPVDWGQRQGNYPFVMRPDYKRVWIHAVSVGEVVAALPILKSVRAELPDWEIVLSVTTSSGRRTAAEQAEGLFDHLVYFPIDTPRFMLAAMSRVQPSVVAIMETELWLNFLWAAQATGARTMLVNGRISPRSYRRLTKLRALYGYIVKMLDRCLMQGEGDAERIAFFGANSVEVFGNAKFDQAADLGPRSVEAWREELGLDPSKRTIVVGSTRSELEESLVLQAIAAIGLDRVQVIHAPRHLERAEALAATAKSMFGTVGQRSKGEKSPYLILDTYGELSAIYAVADVVIIGGGFDQLGGQNLLQPLAHGKPVVHGPNMTNFADVAKQANDVGATATASTVEELTLTLASILEDRERAASMGEAAKAFVGQNLGASERYAQAIVSEAKENQARLVALADKRKR